MSKGQGLLLTALLVLVGLFQLACGSGEKKESPALPAIAYGQASYSFTTGAEISPITPVSSGGSVATWSLSPALPAGQAFSSGSGQITGNPSTSSAATTYTVTATNAGGSATASFSIAVVAALPAAPSGFLAIGSDGQVSLSWNALASASSYLVKRGSEGGPYVQIGAPTAAHFTDSGRTNGNTYYYVVSALNEAGEGPNSSEASATPSAGLPILPDRDPTKNYIGLNVWFLSDWDGSFAFVDAMKQARPWQDAEDWHNPVAGIDALGWPTADASTVVCTGTPAQVNGTYKLVFNGQADVSMMWASGSVTHQVYDAPSNTTTADVTYSITSTASVGLVLRNTKRTAARATNTGFANMHLYRPGYATDGSALFTTPFLNALGKTSAVRMMDWTATNQNLVQHWGDRRTPRHMSKAGLAYTGPGGAAWDSSETGVALEHQIQLANALHSDCWINIPVVADDDYVQKVALALRYGTDGTNPYTSPQASPVFPPLDPSLRVYLEYANEVWNFAGGFDCFGVIHDIVKSLPAGHMLPLYAPEGSGEYQLLYCYPAYRMAAISDIFRAIYGDASMMNRVRPLIMTQQGNANGTLSLALGWLDAYAHAQSREVGSYVYGAGGSGYYNGNNSPVPAADQGNANLFFATGNYPDTRAIKGIGVDAVWAANYGLKRIAYEGGESLDNYSDANARTINGDPRMQDLVVKTHDAWSAQGGDLLMYYTLCGPSSWEFTPDIATTNTPKFKGIDQLQSQPRAAVTLGPLLPGTLVATDQPDTRIRTGYDYASTIDDLACVAGNDDGEWIALSGHASAAFSGHVVVNGSASVTTLLNVWVNGVNKGQVSLASGSHLVDSSSLAVEIPAGLVVIRLEVVSGGFTLRSIRVS